MNTIDILDNGELALFIESLRLANYDISTTEFFAAQDLMVALAAQGKLPKTLAPMKTLLMPILCHSPKEQEDFYQHFYQWVNRVEIIKHDIKQQFTFLQSVWQDIKQAIINLKWFLIFALFALILLFVFPTSFDVEEPIGDLNQIPKTPSQQITPTTPIDSDTTSSNQPYYQQWWVWVIFLLLPLSVLLWYLWQRYKAPPYLIRKSTSQTPSIKQFFAKNINEGIFQSVGMARVAQQLRKHTPIATDLLDLKATIKRTIKAGGWFTPVTGIVKTIPEYLVLIDRTTFKDHHSHLMDALVNQLIAHGIFIARYYFDGDPRHCYPENDELPPLLLTELRDQYPTHRLLMFSDGNGFIDPMTGDIVPWIEQFSGWTQKTFFTLTQPEQWGYQEKLLAEANFLVMPANENGLTTLAEKINAEQWLSSTPYPKQATKNITAFPTYFNDFSQWWLERHAPDRAKVTELLKQVRDFLGEAGYYWFSACAVYPEIRWHLTVYLGYQLKLLNEEREERFAKLARLPWFRYGNMPNWLRDQLIKDLSLSQLQKVDSVLYILLEKLDKPISDFKLEIAHDKKAKLSNLGWWQLLFKWVKCAPKNSSLPDYVFVTFVKSKLMLKAPKFLNHSFFKFLSPFQSMKISTIIFSAIVVIGFIIFFLKPILLPQFTKMQVLEVMTIGLGSGKGTITGEGIECGNDCIEHYPKAQKIRLVATPAPHSNFVGWGKDCKGTEITIVVTTISDIKCTAIFQSDSDDDFDDNAFLKNTEEELSDIYPPVVDNIEYEKAFKIAEEANLIAEKAMFIIDEHLALTQNWPDLVNDMEWLDSLSTESYHVKSIKILLDGYIEIELELITDKGGKGSKEVVSVLVDYGKTSKEAYEFLILQSSTESKIVWIPSKSRVGRAITDKDNETISPTPSVVEPKPTIIADKDNDTIPDNEDNCRNDELEVVESNSSRYRVGDCLSLTEEKIWPLKREECIVFKFNNAQKRTICGPEPDTKGFIERIINYTRGGR